MKKTAKIFVGLALLFASGVFAQLTKPLVFDCSDYSLPGGTYAYTCSIAQYETQKQIPSKYGTKSYTTWGNFLADFQADIESNLNPMKNSSAKTYYSGFVIRFETDIDLGGYGKENGVTTCKDATFAPMSFGALAFQPRIDGKGDGDNVNHTISNFCYITENENASFFENLQNSTVQNITFDKAYVKAKVTSGTPSDAAVVAYRVENVSFKNVTVSNSLVYGWQTATLAVYSGASSSDRDNPAVALSKIKIQNVTLGITEDVIAGLSTVGSLENLQSASGGVIANIGGYPVMDSIEVSKLKIPDAISEVYKSVSGYEYVGDRYVGGVAGRFAPSAMDDGFTLGRISVSADLSGLWVGGLFGQAYIDNYSLTGSSYFNLANAKVTLNSAVHSGGNNKARFLGGLVGELHWLRGQISLSNDTVDVSANWHRETDYLNSKACMGGLVGYVSGEEDDTPVDVLTENNVVTAEMKTSAGAVYAGGVLGQVSFIPGPNTNASGSVFVKKTSVKAKETNLIMTTAETVNTVRAGYLVGNVVTRGGNINILQNHAEGNIYIANNGVVAAGALGGEIGLGWSRSIDVSNNSSVGDLFAKTIVGSNFAFRIFKGYVAGTLVSEGSGTTVSVRDNFHYGTMDIAVFDAVDSLQIASQGKKKSDWRDKCSENLNICFNYRNELKGDSALSASGVLSKDGSGKIIVNTKDGDYWYNGIVDADVMKSRLFTYVLNATQTSNAAPATWENEPSSLPVISSQERTAYLLMVQLDAVYDELTTADKESLDGYLDDSNKRIYAYTEKDGHLSQGFVKKMKALSVNYGLVRNGNVVDLDAAMTYDIDAEATLSRTINVVYEMQDPTNSANITYIPLEDYYSSVVYVWPKVESVQLWNASGLVPSVEGFNTVKTDYMAFSSAYVCMDGEQNCKDKQRESFSYSAMDFESVVASMRYYLNVSGSSTIHLVYAAYNPGLPTVVITNENKDYPVFVNGVVYYGKNPFTRDNRLLAGASSSRESMKSSYKVRVDPGFKLNGWKVDLSLNDESNLVKSFELGADEPLVLDDVLNDVAEQRQKMIAQSQNIIPVMEFYAKVNPDVSPISYTLSFDADADGHSVFVADDWLVAKSYSRESAEAATLPELYGADACFDGWALASDGERTTWGKTIDNDNMINLPLKEGIVNNLVAYWIAVGKNGCQTLQNVPMLLVKQNKQGKTDNFGKVSLWQGFKGDTSANVAKLSHEFENDEMLIPVTDKSMTFHVSSAPKDGYALARMEIETTTSDANKLETAVQEVQFSADDTVFSITPASNVSYTLNAVFGSYIDVALNQDRDDVFYGANSSTNTVRVVEGGQTILPAWIYTADECVLGWNKKSGEGAYVYGTVKSDDLMDVLKNDKDLYAVWGNSDECVAAGYNRLTLDAEHGSVRIAEIDGAGAETMHSFAKDNTMLLPHVTNGAGWRVRGAPERGFKLDSLVLDFVTNGPNNQVIEEHFSLVEGDMLPQFIQGEVAAKAYFSEDASNKGSILLERHEFVQSGNAVRLNLKTNDFGANQSAMLLVILKDAQGATLEIDTLAKKISDTPYEHVWSKYPLLPGKYVLEATLDDGVNADSFDTAFTVREEIAAAPDIWQMVSFSDVDESAIVWDGDPAFYYWDESAEYGVIWKYLKYDGGMVNPQQGIWYNSLEGRPLMLRRDSVRSGSEMVWELDSGWNMVANPYGWNISLDQDSYEMYRWSADAGFGPVSGFAPYEAVWLLSDTKKTVSVKAEPSFDTNLNAKSLQKVALAKATRESWTLQAVLEDTKGHSDSWNVLGVGAAEERVEPPAGMGDYVNLSVIEGKKALLKSIKSADEGIYEWNLALSATTDRVGYLKFEGVKALNEMGLRVYVTIDGKTSELGAGDSLRVLLKAAGSTATVRVSASEVWTVASMLENLRFARLPGALQVGFDVSSDLAGAGYRVQLVGVNGKIAATYRGKSTAGHNTLALTAPKPGLYLLRVTLGGHSAVRKIAISR